MSAIVSAGTRGRLANFCEPTALFLSALPVGLGSRQFDANGQTMRFVYRVQFGCAGQWLPTDAPSGALSASPETELELEFAGHGVHFFRWPGALEYVGGGTGQWVIEARYLKEKASEFPAKQIRTFPIQCPIGAPRTLNTHTKWIKARVPVMCADQDGVQILVDHEPIERDSIATITAAANAVILEVSEW